MKREITILLVALICSIAGFAQEWQLDMAKAKAIASQESKHIVLVFQGSDWCAPCMKLDREVWSTEVFKDYAHENFVMLQADFPRRKANALSDAQAKANAQLAETYNKRGIFPLVVVLDENGKVLGETGYKKTTAESYIKGLNYLIEKS